MSFLISVYFIKETLGFTAINFFTATLSTLLIFIFYKILRSIFSLNTALSLFTSLIFFVSIYDFLISRPHLPAYVLLFTNLFLILLYYFKNKNLLILTLPLTIIWSNLHGSIFLDVYLFASYALVSFRDFKKFKTLAIFTVLTAAATILPPLGLTQYRLLFLFFQKQQVITQFIDEWKPLNTITADFNQYKLSLFVIVSVFFLLTAKTKSLSKTLWTLPLLPFLFAPFLALRNVFLGYIVLILLLGFTLSRLPSLLLNKKILALFFAPIIFFYLFLYYQKTRPGKIYIPSQAVQFIKNNNFKGHLYNGIGVGGYLLYYLYPDQKVFIDGRTDLYLDSVIPDLINFFAQKNKPDEEYKPLLEKFLDKYQISYALLVTKRNTVNRRIGLLLTDNLKWRLVYWDDEFQILVKDDGKNNEIINKYAAYAATPYHLTPVRDGQNDKAFLEYQKMIAVSDSGKSRNALGFIYLQKGELEKSQKELETAISLNPTLASPYMNLGEIAVSQGDFQKAADLYQKAIKIDPARTFAKNRLEEIKALSN